MDRQNTKKRRRGRASGIFPQPPHRLLSAEEELTLLTRFQKLGDKKALDSLILHNIRLVISLIPQYHHNGIEPMDLFQEGVIGLMKAAERFDCQSGNRFSTYAIHWVRRQVRMALNKTRNRAVRLPDWVQRYQWVINQTADTHIAEQGCTPTAKEITQALSLPVAKVRLAMKQQRWNQPGTSTLGVFEQVALDKHQALIRSLREQTLAETLLEKLQDLKGFSKRDRALFCFYYHLDGSCRNVKNGRRRTLADVGKKFDLTCQRTHQIVRRIRERLREILTQ